MLDAARARDIALEVGALAARELLVGWENAGPVRTKGYDTDLVTEWDTRIEALIDRELGARAPGVAILGEELGGTGSRSGERWLVDPVDGTVNFAHGLPIFGISIAFEREGEPQAGVVIAPALGWTWAAARGQGATRNGVPIRVSAATRLADTMLTTGFPYDRKQSPRNNFDAWSHLQLVAGAVRRLGAASLDLCFVACGWLDGYWEMKLKPWDLSAGAVIVEEAGGRVTGLSGGPFISESGEIVATNGRIHDALLAELTGRV
jgi:myo-inositol-1(or 4)-monophosphatase